MSGLSHTPGKRAWGKTHRGFESRLLRQKMNSPVAQCVTGLFHLLLSQDLGSWVIFMADPIRVATSAI